MAVLMDTCGFDDQSMAQSAAVTVSHLPTAALSFQRLTLTDASKVKKVPATSLRAQVPQSNA